MFCLTHGLILLLLKANAVSHLCSSGIDGPCWKFQYALGMQRPNHESVGPYSFGDPNDAPISVKKNGVDGESHPNGMNGTAWIE
jgi:hypothetical protein